MAHLRKEWVPRGPDHQHVRLDQPRRQVFQVGLVVGVLHHRHRHDALGNENDKDLVNRVNHFFGKNRLRLKEHLVTIRESIGSSGQNPPHGQA